jgi:hypothetical protein
MLGAADGRLLGSIPSLNLDEGSGSIPEVSLSNSKQQMLRKVYIPLIKDEARVRIPPLHPRLCLLQ